MDDPDLVTVEKFAQMYRVEASMVRAWVRSGHIAYVLVGPRKLRRIRRSEVVVPIIPPDPPPTVPPVDLTQSESPWPVEVDTHTNGNGSGPVTGIKAADTEPDAGDGAGTPEPVDPDPDTHEIVEAEADGKHSSGPRADERGPEKGTRRAKTSRAK
jgi:hypothetical protein